MLDVENYGVRPVRHDIRHE